MLGTTLALPPCLAPFQARGVGGSLVEHLARGRGGCEPPAPPCSRGVQRSWGQPQPHLCFFLFLLLSRALLTHTDPNQTNPKASRSLKRLTQQEKHSKAAGVGQGTFSLSSSVLSPPCPPCQGLPTKAPAHLGPAPERIPHASLPACCQGIGVHASSRRAALRRGRLDRLLSLLTDTHLSSHGTGVSVPVHLCSR